MYNLSTPACGWKTNLSLCRISCEYFVLYRNRELVTLPTGKVFLFGLLNCDLQPTGKYLRQRLKRCCHFSCSFTLRTCWSIMMLSGLTMAVIQLILKVFALRFVFLQELQGVSAG